MRLAAERRGDPHAGHAPTSGSPKRSRASRRTSSSAVTRTCSSTAPARAAAGQRGQRRACRYEGRRGAYWALLGPEVELRRTEYDVEAAAAASRVRAPGTPELRRLAASTRRSPDEVSAYFESTVARSYVREARRRVGPKRARIRPIIERLRGRASRRDDRAAVPLAARAARLGDALGSDDRRERQPRDRAAVRQVPAAGGLPRRAAGGARARHLRDRLLPPEGEVAARDDADAARRVRRRGAPSTIDELAAPARGGAQDGERRRRRARAGRRGSWSTRTCAGSRSGSG